MIVELRIEISPLLAERAPGHQRIANVLTTQPEFTTDWALPDTVEDRAKLWLHEKEPSCVKRIVEHLLNNMASSTSDLRKASDAKDPTAVIRKRLNGNLAKVGLQIVKIPPIKGLYDQQGQTVRECLWQLRKSEHGRSQ